jgi:hypothetical protein
VVEHIGSSSQCTNCQLQEKEQEENSGGGRRAKQRTEGSKEGKNAVNEAEHEYVACGCARNGIQR